MGATPVPLPVAAAARQSLDLLADGRERETLWARSRLLKEGLRRLCFQPPDNPVPIAAVNLGGPERNRRLFEALLERGFFPPLIRYQGTPAAGHFRFTVSSAHSEEHVRSLLAALAAGVEEAVEGAG
jgi:7-keto-8-aminopelargonate synthetase-like enzyme